MPTLDPTARSARALALAGVAFFVATVVTLPFVQHGHYHVVRQTMSELALGRGGWLMNTAFCVLGVGTIAFAVLVRRLFPTRRVGAAMYVVAGLLDFVSATFHAVLYGQPATSASRVHVVAGFVTFVLMIGGMYVASRYFARSASWRSFSRPTLVWAILATASILALGPHSIGVDHFGVGQRVIAGLFLSWMATTAYLGARLGPAGPAAETRDTP